MIKSRPAVSFLPGTAVLELTYRCNHRCIFCSCPWDAAKSSFEKREELSTREWKDAISKFCEMGVSNIALTGGEPLMRPDLSDLIRHAASCTTEHIETVDGSLVSTHKAPDIYLLSNGLNVDASVFDLCKSCNVQLSMSLPGLSTFARHTGVDNADGVLQNFSEAKSCGLFTVANITVTKLNLFELRETISAALIAGADQILLNRFMPGGRGLSYVNDLTLSPSDIITMLDIAEDVLGKAGRFGSVGTELPKCLVGTKEYKRLQVSTRCSAALEFFVVGPSGYVRVCNHSPVRLCHVSRIDDLKKSGYWRQFTQKDYLPEMCVECPEIYNCDGGCREAAHVALGSIDAPDVLLAE